MTASRQPVLEGVRVAAGRPLVARMGDVTYSVVEPPAPAVKTGEQRDGQRRRTRLRTGKLADARNRFVIECLFHDRSMHGARLRLVEDVPLPASLVVYDDETGTLAGARIMWRRHQDVGIRFDAGTCMSGSTALGATFYAVSRRPSAR